jgi:hypothetical protein
LTLLDAMLQNGDRRIKCSLSLVEFGLMAVGIARDEPLLERLRVLVSDPTTDSHVKEKAVELFRSWSVNFRDEKGMEQLVGLRNQTPTKVFRLLECELLTLETCGSYSSSTNP